MARRCVAIGLVIAVQLAALSAPLVHAHPDDRATDHHRAREIHAHFDSHATRSHTTGEPALDHPGGDDRAVFVHLFIGVTTPGVALPAVVPVVFDLAEPNTRRSLRPIYGTHGHDPPLLRRSASRAPPPFLS